MIWASPAWKSIHTLAIEYDQQKKQQSGDSGRFQDFVNALKNVIPCPKCKRHFDLYLSKRPIQRPFFSWSVNFHNAVSERIGKRTYSVEEARELYREPEVDCRQLKTSRLRKNIILGTGVSLMVVLAVVILYVLYRRRR